MKELQGTVAACRVSFKNELQSIYKNGKVESRSVADKCLLGKEKASSCCCCCCCSSLEIPHSSVNAMEFLCRPWSPSAFDFQHIFTSRNMVTMNNNYNLEEHERDIDDKFISQEREQKLEIEEVNEITAQSTNALSRVDGIWMNSKHKKTGWFRGQPFASLLRQHRVKKKEENRLHTANIHAAISVTQLAAAIAAYAAKGCIEPATKDDINAMVNGGTVGRVKNMDNIVASAAALLATVCAETAESVGAHTSHVAAAVNSGLASQTSADMVTLIATTATCLRGVTALKSRAVENAYSLRNQEGLAVKAQLSIVTPSGNRRHAWVSVNSKHNQIILSLQIKYMGIIARTKEYKILHVMEKKMESQDQGHSITVKSNVGNIKLVFKDENQSLQWISSISNLLKTHS